MEDLIEEFRIKAPGSYKHCQAVAATCLLIAKELDIDPTNLHIAASIHDIGKIINPEFFTENQTTEEDVHKDLPIFISWQMITKHVADSVLILTLRDTAPEIINIVAEHHGTTISPWFKKQLGDDADFSRYRYASRIPASDEAVILMIVDSVEASARSQAGKLTTMEAKKNLINRTIERLNDDEQLDSLTMGTLRVIKKVLLNDLTASYHTRKEYDDE